MELTLNLVWLATALFMLTVWLLMPSRGEQAARGSQAICLALAILLLLPVISLSDDLVAAQAAREADCCLRRAQDGHPLLPHVHVTSWAIAVGADEFHFVERSEVEMQAEVALQPLPESIRLPWSRPPPLA